MFIELAEFVRCPGGHGEQGYCVVVPDQMSGRRVVRGSIGCPACGREYPIVNGVACFGTPDDRRVVQEAPDAAAPADPSEVHAVLALAGPGGYLVLLGSAARHAAPLAELIEGVHFVGVNPPSDVEPGGALSLVTAPDRIPLKSSMARGCVVGAEFAHDPWLAEAARLLLRGLRLVVLREDVAPAGVEQLAVGRGMWVGVRE